MDETKRNEPQPESKDLRRKIDSQKGTSKDFRPETRLDPETGHEISRTGREPSARDVQGMPKRVKEGGDDSEVEQDIPSQNSGGGLGNR